MNELVASLIGNARRESVDGRAYLVAPVAMIVPGVLNGSKGALFYPQDEVEKNQGVWNNVPITIGHPYGKNNEAISARDPKTLEKFQIGAVYNDRFENGKRVADGWFDEALTKKKAPEVYAALNAGTPMEVSTGLFTDDEPAQNGAHHGGVAYQFIAKNYRPDHLAVLPNQRGACSLNDGCGLNTNGFCPTGEGGGQDNSCGKSEGGTSGVKLVKVDPPTDIHGRPRVFTHDPGKLPKGLPEGPDDVEVVDVKKPREAKSTKGRIKKGWTKVGVVKNAVPNQPKSQNTGKYKAMNAGTGKGETHQSAQDGWHGGPRPQECGCPPGVACNCDEKMKSNSKHKRGPKMNREQGVQWLVTNCDCHKGKERVLANADNYTDDEILALVENEQRAQTNQLVVNKFVEALPGVQNVTVNAIPDFVKGKMKADGGEEDGEEPETDEEEMTEEDAPVGNKAKPMSAEQYLARMPAALRPVWDDMVANANSQRAELIAEVQRVVKNERDPKRRELVENKLKGTMTNAELRDLITLIRPTENKSRVASAPTPASVPSYFGMQGGPPAAPTDNAGGLTQNDLLLEIPTMDFSDLASPTLRKKR